MTSSNTQNKENLTQEDIKKNIENSNLEDITGYASFSSFMVDSKKQIETQREEEMPKVDINANFEVISVTTSTKNYVSYQMPGLIFDKNNFAQEKDRALTFSQLGKDDFQDQMIVSTKWHSSIPYIFTILYENNILEVYDVNENLDIPQQTKTLFEKNINVLKDHSTFSKNRKVETRIVDFAYICENFMTNENNFYQDMSLFSVVLLSDTGSQYIMGPIFLSGIKIKDSQLKSLDKKLSEISNNDINEYFEDFRQSQQKHSVTNLNYLNWDMAHSLNMQYKNIPTEQTLNNHNFENSKNTYIAQKTVLLKDNKKVLALIQKNMTINILYAEDPVYAVSTPIKASQLTRNDDIGIQQHNSFVNIATFDMLSQNTKNKIDNSSKFSMDYNKSNQSYITNIAKVAFDKQYMVVDNNVLSIKADWISEFVENIQQQDYTTSQIGDIHDSYCKNCYEFQVRSYKDSDNNSQNNSSDYQTITENLGMWVNGVQNSPSIKLVEKLSDTKDKLDFKKSKKEKTDLDLDEYKPSIEVDERMKELRDLPPPIIDINGTFEENVQKVERYFGLYGEQKDKLVSRYKDDLIKVQNGFKYVSGFKSNYEDRLKNFSEYKGSCNTKIQDFKKKNEIIQSKLKNIMDLSNQLPHNESTAEKEQFNQLAQIEHNFDQEKIMEQLAFMNEKLNRTKDLCIKAEQKLVDLQDDEIRQIHDSEKRVIEKKIEIERDMKKLLQIQQKLEDNNVV